MVTPSGIFDPSYHGIGGGLLPAYLRKRVIRPEPTGPRTLKHQIRTDDPEYDPDADSNGDGIPYDSVNKEVAKVALGEVGSRIQAHLQIKAATESRATTMVNNCIAVLTVVVGAAFYDYRSSGLSAITISAICGGICLFSSIMFSYWVIKPDTIALPGRLPSQIWRDLVDEKMNEKDFVVRLIFTAQEELYDNEVAQNRRGRWLLISTVLAMIAVPFALLSFLVTKSIPGW